MSSVTTSAKNQLTGNFFERHAWKVLLGLSVVAGYFGIGDMIDGAVGLQTGETVLMHGVTGMSWNELVASSPHVANLINLKFRTEGASLTAIALLSAIICLKGFRRGERWAWYALWVLPLWSALTVFFFLSVDKESGAGTPVPVFSGSFFIVVSVLMLGLSSRKFFQKLQQAD